MKKMTIKKSVEINAPKETVWNVLLEDQYTRKWYGVFSEGSHAETDWQLGSKAKFTDNTGCGLLGEIVANRPHELVSVKYTGIMNEGKEDTESDMAKAIYGGLETYRLSENQGKTQVHIESDMGEDYFESMSAAWDKALAQVKSLAETN